MRIIIHSMTFLPKVGGLENIMAGLANQWSLNGHQVMVFTDADGDRSDKGIYVVKRRSSKWAILNAVKESDIFLEANISLKTFWIGLLNQKKWFVTHQIPYNHKKNWKGTIKNRLTKFSNNISASQYIADTLLGKSVVIPNFFSDEFTRFDNVIRERDIVFVGRLVSDKGADDLIRALALLKSRGVIATCSIIGDGPERDNLLKMVHHLGLSQSVIIKGLLKGEMLVLEINRHRIMVVPSRWPEPFGIVALEGLACGCKVICSNGGGLPEAVNGFGQQYLNADIDALAECIYQALEKGEYSEEDTMALRSYLQTRTPISIANKYIEYFLSKSESKT